MLIFAKPEVIFHKQVTGFSCPLSPFGRSLDLTEIAEMILLLGLIF